MNGKLISQIKIQTEPQPSNAFSPTTPGRLGTAAAQIPNLITSVRLVSALAILGLTLSNQPLASIWFLKLFIAAGISDMLDGYIARRFKWCTVFGANLDSISDLTLYIAASTFLLTTCGPLLSPCLPLIYLGAIVQTFHLGYSFMRFGTFPAYHSDFSRLSAYIIFFLVIAFINMHVSGLISAVALIWTFCSLEGVAITTLLKQARQNVPGIHACLASQAQA